MRRSANVSPNEAKDLEQYRSEFFGQLRSVLGNQEGVRIEGDRFVFASEVLFALGSAELSEAGKAEIAKVARILQNVAAAIPDDINWIIRVDGHTDNQRFVGAGKYADNWELSQGRALSVVRYMIDELGIPPGRLAANGFGEFQPVNPADTPEARAQNRRIELKLDGKMTAQSTASLSGIIQGIKSVSSGRAPDGCQHGVHAGPGGEFGE
ncbi:MAG: hypothetical protein EpisKO_24090 [Epibacterium sp.]